MNEIFTLKTDTMVYIPPITRVEVIDSKGRTYVNWDPQNEVQVSLQDDNRTFKA